MTYSYDEKEMRFWQPDKGSKTGKLFCIPNKFGGGTNYDGSTEGKAEYKLWYLGNVSLLKCS